MRKQNLKTGEYYHVYNRGVDKREIFSSVYDFERFLRGVEEFNTADPIGSLYELSIKKRSKIKLGAPGANVEKLVNVMAYCLNPNHFHFILQQKQNDGISKFMLKVAGGYGWYFNNRYKRSGSLFQGRFKAILIDSNEYLLHLSAYINLNNYVHGISNKSKFRSSWDAYIKKRKDYDFLEKTVILNQFSSVGRYKDFMEKSLKIILENKEKLKELESSVGE